MSKKSYYVFPAHAGMNRIGIARGVIAQCVPRTRGDEPENAVALRNVSLCSPHTRG